MTVSRRNAFLLSAAALLTACGGGRDDALPPAASAPPAVIGAQTVNGPSGAQVAIPAGALTQNSAIAITQSSTGAPAMPAGIVTYGQTFAFTPHGTTFQSAVTVSVPFDPAAVPTGTTPLLYKTNAAMNGWDPVAGATVAGGTMTGSVTSFSYLVVASPPPPPPPKLEPTNVLRIWNFYQDGHKIVPEQTKDDFGEVSSKLDPNAKHDFGPLIYWPARRGPANAYGEVFSNTNGSTYWAFVEAPHTPPLATAPFGSAAELNQFQYYKKTQDNAILQFVISKVFLEAQSANLLNPLECGSPTDQSCKFYNAAIVDFSFYAVREKDAAKQKERKLLTSTGGAVWLIGWQGAWDQFYQTNLVDGVFSGNPFQKQDFEFDKDVDQNGVGNPDGGLHAILKLAHPIHLQVPLDDVDVGDTFFVRAVIKVETKNLMQGESYFSAFFRDPVIAEGVKVEYSGLDPAPAPSTPPDPPPAPEPPPLCATGADPEAGTLQFQAASFRGIEHNVAPLVITRTGGSKGAVSVALTSHDGTATADTDYSPLSGIVVFADGEEGERMLLVPMLSDTLPESDETVNLDLTDPRGCAALGQQASAVLTIADDDTVEVRYTIGGTISGLMGTGLVLSSNGSSISPGNGPFTMPAQLADGGAYDLRVTTQPSNPLQVCTVTRGSGTIHGASVTDIGVDCGTPAPNGSLDPAFGSGGKVAINSLRRAISMARQADGKLVILSELSRLSRFNADGTQDTGFGTNGVVIVTFNNSGDTARALALQPDGKIVVVGRALQGISDDFGVARYNADGTLDTTLGTNGKLSIDINGSADEADAVMVQPDGKIVVAGNGGTATNLGIDADFAAVRLTTDGALDAGFGTNGKVHANIAGRADLVSSALLQSDGKVLVAGRVGVDGGALPDTGVVRFTAAGALDTDFSNTGIVRIDLSSSGHDHDEATDLALTSDGKIVVTVQTQSASVYSHTLARLDTNGVLDVSFGTGGIVSNSFAPGGDFARTLAIQSDGRILTAGSTRPSTSLTDDMLITRHNADGSLDTAFGTSGKLIIDFFASADGAECLALQPDGKIVAAGIARNASTNGLAIVRVMP